MVGSLADAPCLLCSLANQPRTWILRVRTFNLQPHTIPRCWLLWSRLRGLAAVRLGTQAGMSLHVPSRATKDQEVRLKVSSNGIRAGDTDEPVFILLASISQNIKAATGKRASRSKGYRKLQGAPKARRALRPYRDLDPPT